MIEIEKVEKTHGEDIIKAEFNIRIDPESVPNVEEETIKEISQLIQFKGSSEVTISFKKIVYREGELGPDWGTIEFSLKDSMHITDVWNFVLNEFNNAGINATTRHSFKDPVF